MQYSVDLDISGATKLTNALMKQIPYAMAVALTRTAQIAQSNIVIAMQLVFDAPTPYTLNSTYVSPATKENLVSEVKLKDEAYKGTPATKYLAPEVFSGARRAKGMEVNLRALMKIGSNQFLVPGRRAPLDQYGNVTGGFVQKVLSSLGAQSDTYANMTKRSKAKAEAAGRSREFFIGTSPSGAQQLGIWERRGRRLWPIFIIVDRAPMYKQRLRFYEIANEVYNREYQKLFKDALADAIATAKF